MLRNALGRGLSVHDSRTMVNLEAIEVDFTTQVDQRGKPQCEEVLIPSLITSRNVSIWLTVSLGVGPFM